MCRMALVLFTVPFVLSASWQREILDWGMIGSFGLGGYLSAKAGPFFETPLIPGAGDRPYLEERVTNPWVYGAMLATAGAVSILPNQDGWLNERSYRHLKGSLLAITSGYFIKELAKDIVGRPRPDYYDRLAKGIGLDEARDSWPSGHAAHFATAATYLSLFTWDEWRSTEPLAIAAKTGITALLVGTWAWVSWTRIQDNRHYPGDIIAGTILGSGTALLGYSCEQWWGMQNTSNGSSTFFEISPFSVTMRVRF
ncbi:phosphatase PAP2 family protein [bacterium]|nr:phosphatase PAP2 family protein [bacterium]